MNLIPTNCKYKIPKGFSFPLGAKEISELLNDFPQYKRMAINFYDRDTFWSSKFKERLKSKGTIKVFEIEYYRPHGYLSSPKHFIESGHYEPRWKINIYALPSEYRNKTNLNIKAIAMPIYIKWLKEIGDTDEYTFHRKSFGIDLVSELVVEL